MGKKKKKSSQEIQDEVRATAHQVWLAGLGAASRAQEKGGDYFHQLVSRGRELESKGRGKLGELVSEVRERMKSGAADLSEVIDEQVGNVLHRLGVPNRDEIQNLTHRVEELNAKISGLGGKPAAKKPAAKKTVAKPAAKKTAAKPAAKKTAARKPATAKASAAKPAAK